MRRGHSFGPAVQGAERSLTVSRPAVNGGMALPVTAASVEIVGDQTPICW
ncbi:hypothetical protein [Kineosporia sp. NBRC 101731]|nr:hypothetical protein [Kineosporia sp. NBRC 101731]